MIKGGVDLIQLRERTTIDELVDLAAELHNLTARFRRRRL